MGHIVYDGQHIDCHVTTQEVIEMPNNNGRSCSTGVYDDCMYETLARLMRLATEDNCTVPWILDNTRICTKEKDINASFWIGWNHVTNQQRDCYRPCHTMTVELGAKNYRKPASNGGTRINIYFSPQVEKITEHHLYTPITMLADVGGYIGLLLGISVLHLAKFLHKIFNWKIKELEKQLNIENNKTGFNLNNVSENKERLSITITRC